jgi:hypothetical protein
MCGFSHEFQVMSKSDPLLTVLGINVRKTRETFASLRLCASHFFHPVKVRFSRKGAKTQS